MSSFVRFHCLSLDLGKAIHNFSTDTLKVYLTNVAPALTDTVYGTPADIGTGGGYTAGGLTLGANAWSQIAGLASLVPGGNVVFTATTGFGPLRYAVLYNFTAALKNLMGYWDGGASVSIPAAQQLAVNFSSNIMTLNFPLG